MREIYNSYYERIHLFEGGYCYDERIKRVQRNGMETVMEMDEKTLERIFGVLHRCIIG